MSDKGLFESDSDYRERLLRENKEATERNNELLAEQASREKEAKAEMKAREEKIRKERERERERERWESLSPEEQGKEAENQAYGLFILGTVVTAIIMSLAGYGGWYLLLSPVVAVLIPIAFSAGAVLFVAACAIGLIWSLYTMFFGY